MPGKAAKIRVSEKQEIVLEEFRRSHTKSDGSQGQGQGQGQRDETPFPHCSTTLTRPFAPLHLCIFALTSLVLSYGSSLEFWRSVKIECGALSRVKVTPADSDDGKRAQQRNCMMNGLSRMVWQLLSQESNPKLRCSFL